MKRDDFTTEAEQSAFNFGAIEAYRTVNEALRETLTEDRVAFIDALSAKQREMFPSLAVDA